MVYRLRSSHLSAKNLYNRISHTMTFSRRYTLSDGVVLRYAPCSSACYNPVALECVVLASDPGSILGGGGGGLESLIRNLMYCSVLESA